MKYLLVVFLCFIAGCATLKLDGVYPVQKVRIVDNRNPSSKVSGRDYHVTAVTYFGDDKITPKALDVLGGYLSHLNVLDSILEVSVSEFKVIHYYPKRYTKGSLLMRGVLLTSPKLEVIENFDLPLDKDYIVCVFDGAINGIPVKGVSYRGYELEDKFGLFITDDPGMITGAKEALKEAAETIFKQYENSRSN